MYQRPAVIQKLHLDLAFDNFILLWSNHKEFLVRETIYMEQLISKISWTVVVMLCLTLGLAPFNPPHIVEKLQMLLKGHLVRPIDWFDLFFHMIPWILLVLKAIASLTHG